MTSDYRVVGRTGMRVSPLALGTMNFGSYGRVSASDGAKMIAAAIDAGINVIDTADVYSDGEAESIIGDALASSGNRDDVVLATKFHHAIANHPTRRGNSRRWINLALDASLRRLRTDYVDLYYAHRPEDATDLEETVDALSDLVRSGKIRYYGTSTFPVSQVVEAQWLGRQRHVRPSAEQPPYSILVRGIESELLPVALQYGIGTFVWSPLAGGWLSGHYRQDQSDPTHRRWANASRHDPSLDANKAKAVAVGKLEKIAAEAGLTLIQLALGFVLSHPAVTSAIIGPRTPEQLAPQLDAWNVQLTEDVLDAIDEVVPPGSTLSAGDLGYTPPALERPELRRRRSAGAGAKAGT